MLAELVPAMLVKRSRSEKDRKAAVICRVEGEEIAAITLSPFLSTIGLPLASAAYAQAKAGDKAEGKAGDKAEDKAEDKASR